MVLRTATVREPDRLTARVFDSATRSSGARLDAHRDGDTFVIDIDLPGIGPAGIDITVDRTVLTIRAERRRAGTGTRRLLVAERPTGSFSRQVLLSDTLDTDRLEATWDDGVLTLDIPLTEPAEPRTVGITPAAMAA